MFSWSLVLAVFSLAGGLFTGADVTKNNEQRSTYGGLAGAILDPCYHKVLLYMYSVHFVNLTYIQPPPPPTHTHAHTHIQYCDTVDNVNQEAFLQMAQAAASVLEVCTHTDNVVLAAAVVYAILYIIILYSHIDTNDDGRSERILELYWFHSVNNSLAVERWNIGIVMCCIFVVLFCFQVLLYMCIIIYT